MYSTLELPPRVPVSRTLREQLLREHTQRKTGARSGRNSHIWRYAAHHRDCCAQPPAAAVGVECGDDDGGHCCVAESAEEERIAREERIERVASSELVGVSGHERISPGYGVCAWFKATPQQAVPAEGSIL